MLGFSCSNSSQWAATPYTKQLFNISCYPSWCSCTEPSLSHLFPLSDIPLPLSRQWKFQVPEMATTTLTLVKVNPQRENFQGSLTTVESTFHTIPEHLPNLSFWSCLQLPVSFALLMQSSHLKSLFLFLMPYSSHMLIMNAYLLVLHLTSEVLVPLFLPFYKW